ncbi:MAG: four helix bundle protein [Verrucomicrobiota bacterium]
MSEPFENADAWKMARTPTNTAYGYCRREPLARDFGLRDHLQRAAAAVMNNSAEGWESLHVAEKRQACNIARRSCSEVRSMRCVLLDTQSISTPAHSGLGSLCEPSGKPIRGLIRSLGDR